MLWHPGNRGCSGRILGHKERTCRRLFHPLALAQKIDFRRLSTAGYPNTLL